MNIDLKLKTYEQLQDEIVTLHTNNYLNDLKINELQFNWNSLREWLERKIELNKEGRTTVSGMTFKGVNEAMYKQFLDKMNELEGKSNDN